MKKVLSSLEFRLCHFIKSDFILLNSVFSYVQRGLQKKKRQRKKIQTYHIG